MSQVLHIFRKDTRRFWIEILISFIVLGVYAVRYPVHWHVQTTGGPQNLLLAISGVDGLMIILVPAAWLLLIARVVQAESLAGDRQWWLTRPYEWKKLLAAKALFLLVWLYIPLLLAQMAVLHEAGFSPLGHASHWLFLLLVISGFVIVPLIAIATITGNFARMALTLVGGLAAVIGFSVIASTHGALYEPTVPYSHHIYILAVLIVGGVAIIALQYAARRVWLARGLIVGVAVLTAGVGITLAAMQQGEIDRQFPAPGAADASPIHVAVVPTPGNPWRLYPAERAGMLYLQLPLEFSGVAEGSAVELNDVKFTMDGQEEQQWTAPWWHWTSPWWTTQELHFLPGTYDPGVQIMMSREQYERFKPRPVTLHVTFAVTELHAAGDTAATISNGDFAVSGYGVCSAPSQWFLHQILVCRSEIGQSRLAHIVTTWSNYPCSGPQPALQDALTGGVWTGEAYTDPLDHVWNPVVPGFVRLDARHSNGHMANPRDLTLCPGTSMHFNRYAITRRTRVSLTIPGFQLPELPHGWRDEW